MGEEKILEGSEAVESTGSENTTALTTEQDKSENTQEQQSSSQHSGSHHHHHHHHHHGSSRRHRSHRRRSRIYKFFNRIRRMFKKLNRKNRISLICALALAFVLVFSVSLDLVQHILYTQAEKEAASNDNNKGNAGSVLKVELLNPSGVLITDAVNRYLSIDLLSEHNKTVLLSNFAQSGDRYDVQNSVSLKISTTRTLASAYKIEIADNSQFKNAKVDYLDGSDGTYSFSNLYANTKYYYRVTAYTSSGVVSETGWFNTADTPRILTVDGINNVRDIGNWPTDSGKRIKQGLLIRGTEIDGAVERNYHLTYDGMTEMLENLGIKFDMDLRGESETPLGRDALGSRVTHKYYGMTMYADIFNDYSKGVIKNVFSDLANPDNYPIYIHCTYGRDRTGTVCYLLEALLGVSRGDCLKEYGLSNLTVESIRAVEEGLREFGPNLTLKEQVELYLISCGVGQPEIDAIREIFLGEADET